MSKNAFIGIDYQEGVPDSYKAVVISGPGSFTRRFETGDPVADYRQAVDFGARHAAEACVRFMELSSVGHFTQDDPNYWWDDDGLLARAS